MGLNSVSCNTRLKSKEMPTFPKATKCDTLQCKAPRVEGSAYCETHGGKPKAKLDRLESNRAYKHRSWESIRMGQLSKQPLCQCCLLDSRVTLASHVDHIFAWRHIGNHAFTNNAFQSLCNACHSLKSASERKGQYLHFAPDGVKTYTLSDYALIVRTI